jgi:ribonuclease E
MTEQPTDGFTGDTARESDPFALAPRYPSWTPDGDQDSGSADSAPASSFGAGLAGSRGSAESSSSSPADSAPKKKAKTTRKRRSTRKPKDESVADAAPESEPSAGEGSDDAPRAKKKRRSTRTRKPKAEAAPESEPQEGSDAAPFDGGEGDDDSAAARKRRRRGSRGGRRRKRGDEDDDGAAAIDSIPGEDDDLESKSEEKGGGKKSKKKSSKRKSSRRSSAKSEDDEDREQGSEDSEGEESGGRKKRKRSRSRSKKDRDRDKDKDKDKDAPKSKAKTRAKAKSPEEKEREANALRTQTIAVNAVEPEERRVAVYEGEIILDFLMNAESQKTLVNDIYRGRVVNLEPAIGAAFIDFGQGRNGFLHTSDVLPLYGEKEFELNDLLTAGLHHEDGDHDADWAEESDDAEDVDSDVDAADADDAEEEPADEHDVMEEIAEIDHLDDDSPEDADEDLEEEEEEEESGGDRDSDDAPKRPARKRRPRRSAAKSDDGEGDGSDPRSDDAPRPARKRSRKKASTRAASSDEDDASGEPDEKPKRKPRTRKRSTKSSSDEDGDGGRDEGADSDDGGEARERRPRKKRSRKAASSRAKDAEVDADEDDAPKKGRSRSKKASKSQAKPSKKAARGGRSSKRESSRGSSRGGGKGRGRGGRQERRPQRERRPINELLKVGDPVVVQITKDAIGDKGPTLTTYISMPGRYLVLMPSMARTGVSRKIPDEKERKRLKRILSSMNTPPDMGVIVRTAGVGRTKTDLQRDLDYLMGLWESFGKKLKGSRGPAPLYLESDVATRTLRDLFNRETKEVLVDDVGVYEQMVSFANALMPEHVDRIKQYDGDKPLFQNCGIEQDFERIFSRRVDLPSGGSIVFDQAEALVAIDVNSGRTRTNSYDFEEIALKTNLEAVPEIARQIKLRDLGGIIVCDFIDMVRSNSNRSVEKLLRAELSSDRARSKLGRISQFGLLELTRQRLGPGTHKKVFMACPRCRGTGRIRSIESRAQAILRRLGGALIQKGFSKVEVRAHPEVIAYLKEDLWDWVRAMEHRTEKEILLTGVPEQAEDSVLRYLRTDGREVRPGGRRKR